MQKIVMGRIKIKKIIIIIFVLFLTGCKAEYNLVYEDDKLNEEFKVYSLKNDNCGEDLCSNYFNKYYYNTNITIDYMDDPEELSSNQNLSKYIFYNKYIIDDKNNYGINLNYSFSLEQYKKSYIVHKLFNNVRLDENSLSLNSINDIFKEYPYLNEIKISFKTDKIIKNTNAMREENNIYYWNITKDNYKSKIIEIVFDKEKNNQYTLIKDGKATYSLMKYILLIILLLLLIFVLLIYSKIKNSNK